MVPGLTGPAPEEIRAMKDNKGWRCGRCGSRLPRTGFVWKSRYRKWKSRDKEYSGYYCDPCADARESGMDMEY